MIKLLFILLIPFMLNASKILSYNIYDRTDRVDVMITFDAPYNGVIKQSAGASKIIIKLESATIEASKSKEISSKFLNSLNITPIAGYTQIEASVPPSVVLKASKTSDSYGLRLRFTNEAPTKENSTNEQNNTSSLSSLPTKQGNELSSSYYIVVGILVIGIVILFLLNKKIAQNKEKPNYKSWLFKENKEPTSVAGENVTIRFQKSINEQNSVVMLDFAEQSYLVVMGTNNVLLDKFTDNKPVTQDDFETILQNRRKELTEFIEEKEPLQIYKEKAASIMYEA
ncbi:MAG: hypothetical protein NTW78_05055 [Campylobacterales bacterium]|nr:hypothetical protein [Campylobacterales bacterium]